MQKFYESSANRHGDPVHGALVTVFDSVTKLPVVIYSDNGVTPIVSDLLTDADGFYEFYVANGVIDVYVKNFDTTKALIGITVYDPLDAGAAGSTPYTPPGAGANVSTVKAQLDRSVNAANYAVAGVVNSAAINAAIAQVTANGGGYVYLPAGFLFIDAPIVITKGIILQGCGVGAGSGAGNSGGTVLRSRVAGGDMITISAESGVVIRDLTIDVGGAIVKDVGTAGIRVQGVGGPGTINRGTRILNVRILKAYEAIVWDTAADCLVDGCFIQDHRNTGVYSKQTNGVDTGHNTITNSIIWDLNNGASSSCITYAKGGDLRIIGNKLLGGDKAVWLNLDDGETGTLIMTGNSCEQQRTRCFEATQAVASKNFGNLVIGDNQFSIIGFPAAVNAIKINTGTAGGGAPAWIKNIAIGHNVYNMSGMGAGNTIDILAGDCVTVGPESINNGGTSGPVGVNMASGIVTGKFIPGIVSNTPSGAWTDSTCRFMAANAVLTFSAGVATVPQATTTYLGTADPSTTEGDVSFYVPFKASLLNMMTRASGGPGSGQSYIYTLRVNGVDTALTATAAGGSSDAQNRTNVVRVPSPAGPNTAARVTLKLLTSATATANRHNVTIQVCQDD